jgi:hypothetical protein
VLSCRVGELGLEPPVAQYVRAIAAGEFGCGAAACPRRGVAGREGLYGPRHPVAVVVSHATETSLLFCLVLPTPPPPPTRAGHYDRRTDGLKISVDSHPDAGRNKRVALEQLVALVTSAQALAAQHGPFKAVRRFPSYNY